VFEKAEADKVLSNLYLAFSREQGNKVYVQDRLKENADSLFDLIDKQNAYFYVCGGTAMGRSIRETLIALVGEKGGLATDKAQSYFKKLQSDGRYVAELWS